MKRASNDADVWTPADATAAAGQGWELLEFWDSDKQRFDWQVFKRVDYKNFKHDDDARAFVGTNAAHDCEPSAKAMRIIFKSKLGEQHGRRKKN